MRTTGAKVVWDQVCLLKKKGRGLGIKTITEWNNIALLKHIWNLCNNKRWLNMVYLDEIQSVAR
jgi:hypothetical protein